MNVPVVEVPLNVPVAENVGVSAMVEELMLVTVSVTTGTLVTIAVVRPGAVTTSV